MHEVSIATSLLDLIGQQLGGVQKLSEVELRVGPLSGVSVHSLEFCFATIAGESGYGSPCLRIEATLVDIQCDRCPARYQVADPHDPCPRCGSWQRTILGGDELQLVSVTLEEENVEREEETHV